MSSILNVNDLTQNLILRDICVAKYNRVNKKLHVKMYNENVSLSVHSKGNFLGP